MADKLVADDYWLCEVLRETGVVAGDGVHVVGGVRLGTALGEGRVGDFGETLHLSLSLALEVVVTLGTGAYLLDLVSLSTLVLVGVVEQHLVSLFSHSEQLSGTAI